MSDSNQKGDVGEAAFALAAAKRGYWTARMPQECPYDFAVDFRNGKPLIRVQIKYRSITGRGSISIKLVQRHFSNRQTYNSDNIDAFAVYVPDLDKVFLVPIDDVGGVEEVTFRCVPAKNKQIKTVRNIFNYEQW